MEFQLTLLGKDVYEKWGLMRGWSWWAESHVTDVVRQPVAVVGAGAADHEY